MRIRRLSPTLLLLAGALLLPAALHGQDPERFLLQEEEAVGDLVEVESTIAKSMTLRMLIPDLPPVQMRTSESEEERYQVELLTQEEDASSATYQFLRRRFSEVDPEGQREDRISPLEGMRITVRRAAGETTITPDIAELDPEKDKSLRRLLEAPDVDFYPEEAVPIGAEWDVPEELFTGLADVESAEGTMKARLEKIEEFEGQRCAVVRFDLDLQLQYSDTPGPTHFKGAGTTYHSLELNRMLRTEMEGTVTLKFDLDIHGLTGVAEGTGQLRVVETHRWLKVAGRDIGGGAARR